MSELPRLDDLIWLADTGAYDADRILQGNFSDGCGQQCLDKFQRIQLFALFVFKPTGTTDGKVRAGRMRNHQVPSVAAMKRSVSA
jgi:hypothetical protein